MKYIPLLCRRQAILHLIYKWIVCILIAIYLFCSLLNLANASVINANISETEIMKSYSFNGKSIEVKVEYGEPITLIANVIGPKKNFKITEETSKYGVRAKGSVDIATNQESFYQLYTSDAAYYRNHYINLLHGNIDLHNFLKTKQIIGKDKAFYKYMINNKLYYPEPKEVINNITHKVMSFTIELPANCLEGVYTINLYGFSDDYRMLGKQKLTFVVRSSGAYNFFKDFSRTHSLGYSLLTIFIAIFIGLIAGYFNHGKRPID